MGYDTDDTVAVNPSNKIEHDDTQNITIIRIPARIPRTMIADLFFGIDSSAVFADFAVLFTAPAIDSADFTVSARLACSSLIRRFCCCFRREAKYTVSTPLSYGDFSSSSKYSLLMSSSRS